jgi:hypothetical protein
VEDLLAGKDQPQQEASVVRPTAWHLVNSPAQVEHVLASIGELQDRVAKRRVLGIEVPPPLDSLTRRHQARRLRLLRALGHRAHEDPSDSES